MALHLPDCWSVNSRTAKALAALALVLGCADTARASDSVAPSIQFLWETDMQSSDDWASYLTFRGFYVQRYQAHDADLIVKYNPDLIIIANDTSPAWADIADVKAIGDSGIPVLAIGKGGSRYYDAANLSIGWLDSGVDFGQSRLHVSDPSNPLWISPNTIGVPPDSIITVHLSDVCAVTPWIPRLPGNVSVLAKDPAAMEYATICTETSRYTMWSFYTRSPAMLTEDGRRLFENVIWHCLRGSVPEFNSILLVHIGAVGMAAIVGRWVRLGRTTRKRIVG